MMRAFPPSLLRKGSILKCKSRADKSYKATQAATKPHRPSTYYYTHPHLLLAHHGYPHSSNRSASATPW